MLKLLETLKLPEALKLEEVDDAEEPRDCGQLSADEKFQRAVAGVRRRKMKVTTRKKLQNCWRSSPEKGGSPEHLRTCKSTWSKRARAERIGGLSKSGMRGKPAGGAVSESASKRAPPSRRPAE